MPGQLGRGKSPGCENKNNCSGFLRSVAGHLNKTVIGQQADDLIEYMRKNWVAVDSGTAAAAQQKPAAKK